MCADNPCANYATYRSSFTEKLYQCLCPAGYKGLRCQTGKQKNPLYRSSEIFNSVIKSESMQKSTKIVNSLQGSKNQNRSSFA